MVLCLFLAMLYQAFLQNILKAVFLTHVLHLEGSHSGVLYKEIVMTFINYIAKKNVVLVNSVKANERKFSEVNLQAERLATLKKICSQISSG